MVDDERDGPYAAVIRLLRDTSTEAQCPSNADFAHRLAILPFLEYRVRRTCPAASPAVAEWHPDVQPSLSQWRRGFDVGAWHALRPPIPTEVVAQNLLVRLSRVAVAHHVLRG